MMGLDGAIKSGLDRSVERSEARAREREAALDAITASFARPEHGPGDLVTGRIEAADAIDCRSVSASLRYAEESCEGYSGGQVKGGPVVLHEGPLGGGESKAFEFRLPDRLLPPQTIEYGRTFWAIWLDIDRPQRADADVRLEIPLRYDRAWETFVPGDRPATAPAEGEGSEWDVSTSVQRWSVRRGEEFAVDLAIGEPSGDRRELSVTLRCYVAYTGEVPSGDSSAPGVKRATLWEQGGPVDASIPQQTLRFRVPEDAPFAFDGQVVSIQWRVTAREPRRLRKDRLRETAVQVRP